MFNLPIGGTDPEQFYLYVNGKKFEGWYDVRVEKSIERFAHTFSVKYTDRWTLEDKPWEIFVDDECVLYWGSQDIISGYIADTNHDITGNSYDLEARGMSYTGDLVDCSAIHKTGQWRNQSLSTIVSDLCDPFAIPVTDTVGSARKFRRFELNEGETVHDAIKRACQIRAAFPVTLKDGYLAIARAGSMGLRSVTLDINEVIHRRKSHSTRSRHSEYYFKGQTSATDEFFGENAALKLGYVEDPSIIRYRPLVVFSETDGSKEDLGERALWERNTRAARSDQITYTVDGVLDPDGKPWEPGTPVKVKDPLMRINKTLLLATVQFVLNTSGLVSNLTLISPEAFDMLELPERGNAWNPR